MFDALTEDQVREIGHLIVERIAGRLRTEHGVELEVSDALIARLAAEGFDAEFGARPLQRHIRRTLEKELTRAISLDGRLTEGDHVLAADAGDDDETPEIKLRISEKVAA